MGFKLHWGGVFTLQPSSKAQVLSYFPANVTPRIFYARGTFSGKYISFDLISMNGKPHTCPIAWGTSFAFTESLWEPGWRLGHCLIPLCDPVQLSLILWTFEYVLHLTFLFKLLWLKLGEILGSLKAPQTCCGFDFLYQAFKPDPVPKCCHSCCLSA